VQAATYIPANAAKLPNPADRRHVDAEVLREVAQRFRPHGTLEVQVEMRLGKRTQVAHGSDHRPAWGEAAAGRQGDVTAVAEMFEHRGIDVANCVRSEDAVDVPVFGDRFPAVQARTVRRRRELVVDCGLDGW